MSEPKPRNFIDYRAIADKYNSLPVGGQLSIPAVYNITLFRRILANHWGLSTEDVRAFQAEGRCHMKRLSEAEMARG